MAIYKQQPDKGKAKLTGSGSFRINKKRSSEIPPRLLLEHIKVFERKGLESTFKECLDNNYQPLFYPQLVDVRLISDKSSRIWTRRFATPSIRAIGKTKGGVPVVVYGHMENYLSNSENIRFSRLKGNYEGAVAIPKTEFMKLLELDEFTDESGNRLVWVLDYKQIIENAKLYKGHLYIDCTCEALDALQFIASIGGEERAKKFLQKLKEISDADIVEIFPLDVLQDFPTARLLWSDLLKWPCVDNASSLHESTEGGPARCVGVPNDIELRKLPISVRAWDSLKRVISIQ